MTKLSTMKKFCICAVCIALSYVLPLAFHAVGLGMAFSPLHLPALLCGLLCGGPYGLLCGIAGPILSSVLSGMPGPAMLLYMVPEVCVYGLAAGLGMRFIHTGKTVADIYLSLIPAMILGRVVGGIARSLFFMASAETYTLALWVSGYVVGTLPAVVMQLIVLPILTLALTQARLIPRRYELPTAA